MWKIIIYASSAVLIVILFIIIIYLYVNQDSDEDERLLEDNPPQDSSTVSGFPPDEDSTSIIGKISYVACDDSTITLNVRSEPSGSIIDSVSCFKELDVIEPAPADELCENWYKVKYTKRKGNYTGYVCGSYLKTPPIEEKQLEEIKSLVSKTLDYYTSNNILPYCGDTFGNKTIIMSDGIPYEYLKSEFKSLSALKSYLLSFMDERLLTSNLQLSNSSSPKYNDDYYEIDGNLYCRGYSNKEEDGKYTGSYDIEVASTSLSKTELNIAYEYLAPKSTCTLSNLTDCYTSDFVYELGKVTITSSDGMNIVSKIDFPKVTNKN